MDLPNLPIQFGRGLNLAAAPEQMGDGQCRVLENFRTLGTGRITTRKAALTFSFLGGQPVLAIEPYTGLPGISGIALTFQEGGESDIGGLVNLWTIDGYGGEELIGPLAGWVDVYESVRVHVAVLNSIAFIVDEDREFGMTVWDPNYFLGGMDESGPAAFFQPTFVFAHPPTESGESLIGESLFYGESFDNPQPMYASFILEHENHLWAFGYGSEEDPDRPEYGRFSYLGLVADDHAPVLGGDAGLLGAPGSANLFDVEDVVPILNRGERIVGAGSAPGRMVVCSDDQAYAIYGQDWETWRKDKIDSQRGLVNSYAIGEENGDIGWMSPLGPCHFKGSVVEDVTEMPDGGSIRPLLDEIDMDSVLFGHAFSEGHVRYYYRRKDDPLPFADRWVGIHYKAGTHLGDRHVFKDGSRIRCVGMLRPAGVEKPASQPLALTHVRIGAHTATAVWHPGDSMPGVRTAVRLIAPDGTRLVATLEGGSSRFTHTGLKPSTSYATEIEETKNGASLGPVRTDFTTLAETQVLGIENPWVLQSSYLSVSSKLQSQLFPMLDVTWDLAESGLTVAVERALTEDGTFTEVARLQATIYHDKNVTADVTYYYRLKAFDRNGNSSAYTAVMSGRAATVTPATGVGSGLPGEGASQGFDVDEG